MMHPHVEAAAAALRESARPPTLADAGPSVNYSALRDPSTGLRVNKWDAQILDSEIMGLLKAPFRNMFSMFEPGVVESVKPEIDALLSAVLFLFSTGLRRPTPGMKLENVQFAPEALTKKKISALFMLSVGFPYLWKRAFRYLSLSQWTASTADAQTNGSDDTRRARLLALMKRFETFVIACQLANLLVFLHKGTYRSLPERCLGLQLRSIVPTATPRMINFEYMTRQLLWDGLMEFGSFALPFLTWSRITAPASGSLSGSDGSHRVSQCSLCGITPPQTPYITSCKHLYCYYCLQTAVAADDDFSCVACGVKFDSSQRLRA